MLLAEADHAEQLEGVGRGRGARTHDVVETHLLYSVDRFEVFSEVHDLAERLNIALIGQL